MDTYATSPCGILFINVNHENVRKPNLKRKKKVEDMLKTIVFFLKKGEF